MLHNPKATFVSALLLLGICTPVALAQSSQPEASVETITQQTSDRLAVAPRLLTNRQRWLLTTLLRGSSTRSDLIPDAVRRDLAARADSVPPEVQSRLQRGQALPADLDLDRQVYLSSEVNEYLGLPPQAIDLIVIGSNVAVYDPSAGVVVDLFVCPGIFSKNRC